ncbi:hypothetical protein Vadar_001631 [Vaccinium darrowii]|uniref:Uncharacterized protein n=1 Tax=Vaccinium darrowii TaxID=229202 RepID=A0ACB7XWE5_9ERIC|nr:hypothetical protein Vadar_001631 [Vaccinium darrowii]
MGMTRESKAEGCTRNIAASTMFGHHGCSREKSSYLHRNPCGNALICPLINKSVKRRKELGKDMMNDDEVENPDVEVSESESGSEDEDVKLTEPSKTSIYNTDGLLDKLDDVSWPLRMWNGYTSFPLTSVKSKRPPDYYADMVKSDSHMVKVKGRLLAEKRRIEEADERRKARESKKIAKEVQAQKLKERAKNKKDEIESVKKWRKQRQQSGFAGGDKDGEMGLTFEDGKSFEKSNKKRPGVAPFDRTGGKGKRGGAAGGKRKGKDFKDSKFGFGGRKGMKKQNTAETTNDFRSFNKGEFSGNKKRKRLISDNILIAHEIIEHIHRKKGSLRGASAWVLLDRNGNVAAADDKSLSSIGSYDRDPTSVLKAALQATLTEARQAIAMVTKFNSLSVSLREQVAIQDCKELLDFSVSELAVLSRAEQNPISWLKRPAISRQLKSVAKRCAHQLHSLPFKPSRNSTGNDEGSDFPKWMTEGDKDHLLSSTNGIHVDAIVALDGTGHYRSITEAVYEAPSYSNRRYVIYIKKGVYEENIDMKKKKSYIMFVGDGIGQTVVTGNRNFMQGWTTFRTAAVVDFIFGNGAAVLQNCKIFTRTPLPLQKVTITAQGRKDPHQSTGFSIQDSYVYATQPTYLGRPWKQYSRTVFMNTFMTGLVQPRGWLEWNGDFALSTLWYGEYRNYGPGASLTGRVKWPGYHMIRDASVASYFTVRQFINGVSWLPATGVKFSAGLSN